MGDEKLTTDQLAPALTDAVIEAMTEVGCVLIRGKFGLVTVSCSLCEWTMGDGVWATRQDSRAFAWWVEHVGETHLEPGRTP